MNEFITSLTCVFAHKEDDRVKYRLEDADKCFGEFTSTGVVSTNTPDDAPAEIARLTFSGNKKSVALSKSQIQSTFNFDKSDKSVEEVFSICLSNLHKLHTAAKKFQPEFEFTFHGVAVGFSYPAPPIIPGKSHVPQMCTALEEIFYKGEKFGSAVVFDLKVGFLTEHLLYRNISVNTYETRSGSATVGYLDFSKLDLIETGIGLSLDVNDRPRLVEGSEIKASFDDVLTSLEEFFKTNTYRDHIRKLELR